MPLIEHSQYHAPWFFANGHIATIYRGKFKHTTPPDYVRERVELPDGDFLDTFFAKKSTRKAVILFHGLEGSMDRTYNNTAAHYFLKMGYSVVAWNNRSCGGVLNRLPKMYHHASVDDVDAVVQHVLDKGFEEVFLLGLSLGGAQILNYFGRMPVDERVKAGVCVSAPIHLKASAEALKHGFNRVYMRRFIKSITPKIQAKAEQFPDLVNADFLKDVKSFDEIDNCFTAPIHGFKNADDYYEKASPAFSLAKVRKPVLILNALDDPFMGKDSYPWEFAKNSPNVFLETPRHGGHCGFPMLHGSFAYSEIRAFQFFERYASSKER